VATESGFCAPPSAGARKNFSALNGDADVDDELYRKIGKKAPRVDG